MVGASKILTVSYGTFSCTLEGFDDPFSTMRGIAEYFRDLAADDRYFGAEPPTPDAEMLHQIAQREVKRRVEAQVGDNGITLRQVEDQSGGTAHALAEDEPGENMFADIGVDDSMPAADADDEAEAAEAATVTAYSEPEPGDLQDAPEDSVAAKLSRIRAVVSRGGAAAAGASIESAFVDVTPEAEEPAAEETKATDAPEPGEDAAAEAEAAAEAAAEEIAVAPEETLEAEEPADEIDAAQWDQAAEDIRTPEEPEAPEAEAKPVETEEPAPAEAAAEQPTAEQAAPVTEQPEPAEETLAARIVRLKRAALGHASEEPAPAEPKAEEDAAPEATAEAPAEAETTKPEPVLEAEAPAAPEPEAEPVAKAEPEPQEAAEADDGLLAEPGEDEELDDDIESIFAEDDAEEPEGATDPDKEPEAPTAEIPTEAEEAAAAQPEAEVAEVAAEASEGIAAELPEEAQAENDDFLDELEDDASDDDLDVDLDEMLGRKRADGEEEAEAEPAAGFDEEFEEEPKEEISVEAMRAAIAEATSAIDAQDSDGDAAETGADKLASLEQEQAGESSFDRILEQTNSRMDDSEGNRRRSAIAHLKAAVAATKADRLLKRFQQPEEADAEEQSQYRDDLAQVVHPNRPAAEAGEPKAERPKPLDDSGAPLVLVSEQRVDESAAGKATDVEPRRVDAEAAGDDDMGDDEGFAEFAEKMGARELPDLLEAAAAYCAFVEGRKEFSRPQLMRRVASFDNGEITREASLRSFGQLLRQGKIQKLKRGQFTVTAETKFNPEARIAGE